MDIRYLEFFDMGSKNAVTFLNEFITAHALLETDPIQFAFDAEGRVSILVRVKGSSDACHQLELEYEESGCVGSVM